MAASKSAVFDCAVNPSELMPKITWKQTKDKKKTPVSELGSRFTVFSNGSLEIKRLIKSDQAFYVCIASNFIGTVQTSAYLRVLST